MIEATDKDWRAESEERAAARKASLVRLAIGPVFAGVLGANLITAAIIYGVYFVFTH